MYLKAIPLAGEHLTSVLLNNNNNNINIFKRNYLGKHFPSDLRKLPCCAVKACLLSKIFSVSGDYLESFSNIQVLRFGCFPNILDITYITCHNIYCICGFALKVSSYGVRVVGLIGNNIGGVHMGAGEASELPARLRKCW